MNIIATINPWSDKNFIETINNLKDQSINIIRINTKVATLDEHFSELFCFIQRIIETIPDIKFMFDIGYPKDTVRLSVNNSDYNFTVDKEADYELRFFNQKTDDMEFIDNVIYLNQKPANLKEGDKIVYGDGKNIFTVKEKISCNSYLITPLATQKVWSSAKLHFPNTIYSQDNYLDLFLEYVKILPKKYIFGIALSFIETKEEVDYFREITNNSYKIISKIESDKAIINIQEIMNSTDFLMLGRGDLLFSLPQKANLLDLERKISKLCRKNNIPFIFATGYLESLSNNFLPARADIVDYLIAKELGAEYITISKAVTMNKDLEVGLSYLVGI